MMNWWWTDNELMMNWWWTDDELVMSWWWTDDVLVMNWWWIGDEHNGLKQFGTTKPKCRMDGLDWMDGFRALWFWIFLEFQYGQADSSVSYRNSEVWPYTGLWRSCWNPPRNYTRVWKILQWQEKRMFSLLPTFLRLIHFAIGGNVHVLPKLRGMAIYGTLEVVLYPHIEAL